MKIMRDVELGDIIYINGVECKITVFGMYVVTLHLDHDDITYIVNNKVDTVMSKLHTIVKGKYVYDGQPISVLSKNDYKIEHFILDNYRLGDVIRCENDKEIRSPNIEGKIYINNTEWIISTMGWSGIATIVAEHDDVVFIIGSEQNKSIVHAYLDLPIHRKGDVDLLSF